MNSNSHYWQPLSDDGYFTDRTILTARNDSVDEINTEVTKQFPGEARTYLSADSVEGDEEDQHLYPTEFLNSLELGGFPHHKLVLKVGMPIMVLRNLDPRNGVCNGTRAVITHMSNRVLEVRILGGDHAGKSVFIPRITLIPDKSHLPFTMRRRQYPIRVAFGMTINKSQGQSVKYVGVDLRTPVFAHGQFYVAMSRCTSGNRIKVLLPEDAGMKAKNLVWEELLID